MLAEPLSPPAARQLIDAILVDGDVRFSKHALEELANDNMETIDAVNVLRGGGLPAPAELENGSWRYRVSTANMAVVIAFRSETALVVVTAWRRK